MPRLPRRPLVRTATLAVLVAAGVVSLEGIERGLHWWRGGQLLPDRHVAWIWDGDWPRNPPRAHAFQAFRRFQIATVPESARLLLVADEEYLVHLNGQWVGMGSLASGDGVSWDSYDIDGLLRRGENRLVVQLRSARGVGGMLLCLQAAGEGCLVRSDGSWTVIDRHFAPDAAPAGGLGRPALEWGTPPSGRWPLPSGSRERPLAFRCVDHARAYAPQRIVSRGTSSLEGGPGRIPVWRMRWDSPITGVLRIELPEPGRATALLRATEGRRVGPGAERLEMVVQPGERLWTAADARSMRLVDAHGLAGIASAWVHPLVEGCEALLAPAPRPVPGLLGLAAPPSRTPVEDELRREFEGVAGL